MQRGLQHALQGCLLTTGCVAIVVLFSLPLCGGLSLDKLRALKRLALFVEVNGNIHLGTVKTATSIGAKKQYSTP